MVDEHITCRKENKWIGSSFFHTNLEDWMIGMLDNHLLAKMNWSDHVLKNSNACSPRPAGGYFHTKRDNVISYMVMNLLLNSINKVPAISPIDKMNVTVNNTWSLPQNLLHTIVNNQNLSHKEPSQLWVLFNEAIDIITNN